jgi:hypothetical protein
LQGTDEDLELAPLLGGVDIMVARAAKGASPPLNKAQVWIGAAEFHLSLVA